MVAGIKTPLNIAFIVYETKGKVFIINQIGKTLVPFYYLIKAKSHRLKTLKNG